MDTQEYVIYYFNKLTKILIIFNFLSDAIQRIELRNMDLI